MKIIFLFIVSTICATAQPWSDATLSQPTVTVAGGGGGGGLTIVQTNNVRVLKAQAVTPWTTNVLTSVTAGNTILVMVACETDTTGIKIAVITDNQSNTYTKRADAEASNSGNCELWTAKAGSSGTIYITNTWSQVVGPENYGLSACAVEISGVETTLAGANPTAVTAQTAPSASITTTRVNSFIFGVVCDYSAKAPPVTYRAGGLQIGQDDQTTAIYRADYFYIPATSATSYTAGESAPTSQQSGMCLYEIRTP